MIPYGHQSIDDDDIAAVVAVLKGDWLTQGPMVEEFERDLAIRVGAMFAVAFSSGTAALHAAAAVGDLGPGDTVATSALTFAASANCARYVGARPVLVDIDESTLNIDLDQVPTGIDGLVAVHFAGLPVDLRRMTRRPRLVIEDASHAIGAETPDGPVGNCAHSDMCVFSFHPVKTITTGEGGMVTTNDARLADRLRRFRSHGAVPTPERGPWAYDVTSLGFNYRMSDIHAALGVSQLRKLEHFLQRRAALAHSYQAALVEAPVMLPPTAPHGFQHGLHLFPVRVGNRARVFAGMQRRGVGVQVHYVPLYAHQLMADAAGRGEASFPHTAAVYRDLMSLPLFPDLTEGEQSYVVSSLLEEVAG